MHATGLLHDRQQRLRQQLLNDQQTWEVSRMLANSEPKEQAMYLVMQAVVCILHLENQVGLKSIESILCQDSQSPEKGCLCRQQQEG